MPLRIAKLMSHALTASLFLLLACATPAAAVPGPGGPRGPGPGPGGPGCPGCGPGGPGGPGAGMHINPQMLEKAAAKLGLSDKTLETIRDLAYKADKQMIDLRAAVESEHLELRRLMESDKPDTDAVMKQIEKVGKAKIRMQQNRVGLLLAVRAQLTPEQQKQLRAMMADRMGRKGRGGGGPGQGGRGFRY